MLFAVKESNTRNLLYIILIVAAFLRLTGLTAFSLSNDELSALARLQYDSVFDVIKDGVYVDFHPAGVQVFLYYWTKLFGFGEFAVRLPFALMGVGSVYFLYRVGKMWFGESTALLAALSLAILEYPLLYSQIARPYSPGLFFSLLSAFFWTRLLFSKTESESVIKKYGYNAIGFALSVSACMYTHYFSFIFAGILCFAGLFFIKKKTLVPYLVSGLLIVILYIPHINLFLYQLSKGGVGGADGWLGAPKSDAFEKYIDYCFNDSSQLKLIFIIILFGTILAYRGKVKLNLFHLLSVVLFGLPFAIAYYYSIYKNPVFQHSVLLFSFPFLLLFIFSFIPKDTKGFTLSILFYSVLAAGLFSTVTEKNYYTTPHFTEFRGVAKKIKQFDEQLGKENITRSISIFDPYYINYYLDYYNHKTEFSTYALFTKEQKHDFYRLIDTSSTNYFEYSFSNVYDPPEYDMIIRSKYPWLISKTDMAGAGVKLYSKIETDTALNLIPQFTYDNNFESGILPGELELRDTLIKHSGAISLFIKKDIEYSPAVSFKTGSISCKSNSTIELRVVVLSNTMPSGSKLVISIDDGDKSLLWKATDLSEFYSKSNEWFTAFLVADVNFELKGDEELKVYCWNEKGDEFYIDDLHFEIYSPR